MICRQNDVNFLKRSSANDGRAFCRFESRRNGPADHASAAKSSWSSRNSRRILLRRHFWRVTFSKIRANRSTIFRAKPNYIKLELKFNEDRSEFTGSGIHFANKQAFEVVEGAVNKKTKYWKFICAYEGGRKKATGRKELVQVFT